MATKQIVIYYDWGDTAPENTELFAKRQKLSNQYSRIAIVI